LSLAISHDGTQVVALLETNGSYQLVASALVRGDKSVPVALGPSLLRLFLKEPRLVSRGLMPQRLQQSPSTLPA